MFKWRWIGDMDLDKIEWYSRYLWLKSEIKWKKYMD